MTRRCLPRVGKRTAEEIDRAYKETERKRREWLEKRRLENLAKGLTRDGKPK